MAIRASGCIKAGLAFALTCAAMSAQAFDTVFHNGYFSANHDSPLGTNLEGVVDYSSSYNFVDVMKPSRGWITQNTVNFVFDAGEQACFIHTNPCWWANCSD